MLSIIGASFGRSGTHSLRTALHRLGRGPCHTMRDLVSDPIHAQAWWRAADDPDPDLDALLAGYRSTVSWPAGFFWRRLARFHPQARVLLVVRDPQEWYDSMVATWWRGRADPLPDTDIDVHHAIDRIVWRGAFCGRFPDRRHAVRVYRRHIAEVRDTVEPGRLIEYRLGTGWGPLCSALDAPIPDEPFPYENPTITPVPAARPIPGPPRPGRMARA